MRFDWKKPCAYDAPHKEAFHRHARAQLKLLAKALGLEPEDYDLRSNKGGIAVSGEVTLHTDKLYVQVSQPVAGLEGLMFRACKSRKDYTGKQNHFVELIWLDSPKTLAEHIRRFLPDSLTKREAA